MYQILVNNNNIAVAAMIISLLLLTPQSANAVIQPPVTCAPGGTYRYGDVGNVADTVRFTASFTNCNVVIENLGGVNKLHFRGSFTGGSIVVRNVEFTPGDPQTTTPDGIALQFDGDLKDCTRIEFTRITWLHGDTNNFATKQPFVSLIHIAGKVTASTATTQQQQSILVQDSHFQARYRAPAKFDNEGEVRLSLISFAGEVTGTNSIVVQRNVFHITITNHVGNMTSGLLTTAAALTDIGSMTFASNTVTTQGVNFRWVEFTFATFSAFHFFDSLTMRDSNKAQDGTISFVNCTHTFPPCAGANGGKLEGSSLTLVDFRSAVSKVKSILLTSGCQLALDAVSIQLRDVHVSLLRVATNVSSTTSSAPGVVVVDDATVNASGVRTLSIRWLSLILVNDVEGLRFSISNSRTIVTNLDLQTSLAALCLLALTGFKNTASSSTVAADVSIVNSHVVLNGFKCSVLVTSTIVLVYLGDDDNVIHAARLSIAVTGGSSVSFGGSVTPQSFSFLPLKFLVGAIITNNPVTCTARCLWLVEDFSLNVQPRKGALINSEFDARVVLDNSDNNGAGIKSGVSVTLNRVNVNVDVAVSQQAVSVGFFSNQQGAMRGNGSNPNSHFDIIVKNSQLSVTSYSPRAAIAQLAKVAAISFGTKGLTDIGRLELSGIVVNVNSTADAVRVVGIDCAVVQENIVGRQQQQQQQQGGGLQILISDFTMNQVSAYAHSNANNANPIEVFLIAFPTSGGSIITVSNLAAFTVQRVSWDNMRLEAPFVTGTNSWINVVAVQLDNSAGLVLQKSSSSNNNGFTFSLKDFSMRGLVIVAPSCAALLSAVNMIPSVQLDGVAAGGIVEFSNIQIHIGSSSSSLSSSSSSSSSLRSLSIYAANIASLKSSSDGFSSLSVHDISIIAARSDGTLLPLAATAAVVALQIDANPSKIERLSSLTLARVQIVSRCSSTTTSNGVFSYAFKLSSTSVPANPTFFDFSVTDVTVDAHLVATQHNVIACVLRFDPPVVFDLSRRLTIDRVKFTATLESAKYSVTAPSSIEVYGVVFKSSLVNEDADRATATSSNSNNNITISNFAMTATLLGDNSHAFVSLFAVRGAGGTNLSTTSIGLSSSQMAVDLSSKTNAVTLTSISLVYVMNPAVSTAISIASSTATVSVDCASDNGGGGLATLTASLLLIDGDRSGIIGNRMKRILVADTNFIVSRASVHGTLGFTGALVACIINSNTGSARLALVVGTVDLLRCSLAISKLNSTTDISAGATTATANINNLAAFYTAPGVVLLSSSSSSVVTSLQLLLSSVTLTAPSITSYGTVSVALLLVSSSAGTSLSNTRIRIINSAMSTNYVMLQGLGDSSPDFIQIHQAVVSFRDLQTTTSTTQTLQLHSIEIDSVTVTTQQLHSRQINAAILRCEVEISQISNNITLTNTLFSVSRTVNATSGTVRLGLVNFEQPVTTTAATAGGSKTTTSSSEIILSNTRLSVSRAEINSGSLDSFVEVTALRCVQFTGVARIAFLAASGIWAGTLESRISGNAGWSAVLVNVLRMLPTSATAGGITGPTAIQVSDCTMTVDNIFTTREPTVSASAVLLYSECEFSAITQITMVRSHLRIGAVVIGDDFEAYLFYTRRLVRLAAQQQQLATIIFINNSISINTATATARYLSVVAVRFQDTVSGASLLSLENVQLQQSAVVAKSAVYVRVLMFSRASWIPQTVIRNSKIIVGSTGRNTNNNAAAVVTASSLQCRVLDLPALIVFAGPSTVLVSDCSVEIRGTVNCTSSSSSSAGVQLAVVNIGDGLFLSNQDSSFTVSRSSVLVSRAPDTTIFLSAHVLVTDSDGFPFNFGGGGVNVHNNRLDVRYSRETAVQMSIASFGTDLVAHTSIDSSSLRKQQQQEEQGAKNASYPALVSFVNNSITVAVSAVTVAASTVAPATTMSANSSSSNNTSTSISTPPAAPTSQPSPRSSSKSEWISILRVAGNLLSPSWSPIVIDGASIDLTSSTTSVSGLSAVPIVSVLNVLGQFDAPNNKEQRAGVFLHRSSILDRSGVCSCDDPSTAAGCCVLLSFNSSTTSGIRTNFSIDTSSIFSTSSSQQQAASSSSLGIVAGPAQTTGPTFILDSIWMSRRRAFFFHRMNNSNNISSATATTLLGPATSWILRCSTQVPWQIPLVRQLQRLAFSLNDKVQFDCSSSLSTSQTHVATPSHTASNLLTLSNSANSPSLSQSETQVLPPPVLVLKETASRELRGAAFIAMAMSMSAGYAYLGRKVLALASLADCRKRDPFGEVEEVEPDVNPLFIYINGETVPPGRASRYGAIIGLPVTCVAWVFVVLCAALIRSNVVGGSLRRNIRKLRTHGQAMVPTMVLAPPVAAIASRFAKEFNTAVTQLEEVSTTTISNGDGARGVVFIILGFVFSMVLPLAFLVLVLRHVHNNEELLAEVSQFNQPPGAFPNKFRALLSYLFDPQRSWKNTSFVKKFGVIFDNMKIPWFVLGEFVAVLGLSVADGIAQACTSADPLSCCDASAVLAVVVCAFDVLLIFILRPLLVRFEAIVFPIVALLNLATASLTLVFLLQTAEKRRVFDPTSVIITLCEFSFLLSLVATVLAATCELVPTAVDAIEKKLCPKDTQGRDDEDENEDTDNLHRHFVSGARRSSTATSCAITGAANHNNDSNKRKRRRSEARDDLRANQQQQQQQRNSSSNKKRSSSGRNLNNNNDSSGKRRRSALVDFAEDNAGVGLDQELLSSLQSKEQQREKRSGSKANVGNTTSSVSANRRKNSRFDDI